MKQKKLLIVMVCVLALALAACGGDKDGGSGGSGGASGEGASGAAADAAATAQYESEAKLVRELMGADRVYWSAGQTHYHLFADCAELATTDAAGATTTAPMTGTAAQALAAIPGASLCLICDNRALTTTGLPGNTAILGQPNGAVTVAAGTIPPDAEYAAGYSAVVSSDEGLRLRKGPGTDYDVLTLLSKGEKLSVLGISASSPDWTYVRYDTYEGWVASQYLTFSGTGTLLTDTD